MDYRDSVPLLLFLCIVGPWIGALLIWVCGDQRPRTQHTLATIASIVAAVAAVLLLPQQLWATTDEVAVSLPFGPFIGDLTFVIDGLGVYLAAIATVIGSLTVIFSIGYMAGAAQLGRYYALVLLFIGSMCGLVLSGNLLFLFLFWEATAFCSYALISFHNDDPRAVSAGIKALIITQLGGVGLLIGIIIAASYLPDLQISTLLAYSGNLPGNVLAIVAFGFLFAAMAKSAQVPLHIWLPDAMEAPTPVSALIHAATMVNAGVYLLARFYPSFVDVPAWTTVVIVVGLLSALLAALMATVNNDLKRVLAYSTVSQLGYMVTGVGIGAIFESQFYLFSHAIFKALLFLGAGAIIHAIGTRDMRRMGNLWQRLPQVAIPFLIGAAALVGLPFFNGFWSKELLLESAFEYNPVIFGILALVAGITAYYATRMCWMVFFAASKPQVVPSEPSRETGRSHVSPAMMVALVPLAIGVVTAWLLAENFAVWLQTTLSYHGAYLLHGHSPESVISLDTILSLTTAVTLTITLLGMATWWLVKRRKDEPEATEPVAHLIQKVEGVFIQSADGLAATTQGVAAVLQKTQTGQLNWNIAGIVMAIVVLLAIIIGIG